MHSRIWRIAYAACVLGAIASNGVNAQDPTPESRGFTRTRVAIEPLSLPKGTTYAELPRVDEVEGKLPMMGSAKPMSMPSAITVEGGTLLPFEQRAISSDQPFLKFKPGDEHLLQMESGDGLFKFFVGGRLQIDGTWLSTTDRVQAPRAQGGIGDVQDAVNFRRARFDFGGTFYKNIDFLMEWDFINTVNAERNGAPLPVNTPAPTELWVTFKDIPYVGNFRIGNQKPQISFEHLTSSRFLNFMERSLAFDAFAENQNNGFEPGAVFFNQFLEKRLYGSVGVYKNTRNIFGWNTGDGEYDVTGRVAFLPVWENEGEQLVHIGLGASHRDLDDHQERLRARLMVRDGPAVLHNIVAEARMMGESRDMVVPEFVVVNGPFTFQTEYYATWVRGTTIPPDGPGQRLNLGTTFYEGGYFEALYFLTGEHKSYNRNSFAFSRVTPKSNFRGFNWNHSGNNDECDGCNGGGHGWGAWEIGLRYSWLDLDNRGVKGGMAQDVTIGLNWYLNPYMKWQWNYTCLYRNAPNPVHDGYVHGFGTRLAFDF